MSWPHGFEGAVLARGRARDLVTRSGGEALVLEEASMQATIDCREGRHVREITTSPHVDGIEALVGVPALRGFRRNLEHVAGAHRDRRSPLYLLLDELPVATVVSGYAILYAGAAPAVRRAHSAAQYPDLCSGYRSGGTILAELERTGVSPVSPGPDAPSILRNDDALAWHELEPLGPNAMRRHRRLDVIAGDPLELDVFFRDSHSSSDCREGVVHEYTVAGTVDPKTLRFLDLQATARVLPYVECPEAVASARRLAGEALLGLRRKVASEFTGISTCTHLNDTLRSLEDVRELAALLR